MRKLSSEGYREIKDWMYRNARPVDLVQWQYHFENGSKEAVLSMLTFYQNNDGGFGNALEADSWNPNSSPYTTLRAIHILKSINFSDVKHPIMQGIFKFLESGEYLSENGWSFSIPSNNDYAHAPWWTYDSEANKVESIGVTAEIASFIIRFAGSGSEIYKKAVVISRQMIDKLKMQDEFGDMGIGGYCVLLDTIQQCELENTFEYDLLLKTVKKLVYDKIERDTTKWAFYGKRPSDYINTPNNMFYKDNEDIMLKELDYLIETRPENSVWNITWSWFDNNEKYPKEFAISENWWKAAGAIEKIKLLRDFDRL